MPLTGSYLCNRIGFSYITPAPKRFQYVFVMQDSTDFNAGVVFNTGTSYIDVYIDNVSSKRSLR